MKVKIGDHLYDAKKTPIVLRLDKEDMELLHQTEVRAIDIVFAPDNYGKKELEKAFMGMPKGYICKHCGGNVNPDGVVPECYCPRCKKNLSVVEVIVK